MLTRFDRYLLSEIHSPFAMAMLVYNGIFFIRTFTEVASISGDVDFPFWLYALLFASYLPEILYITIPMSFLFGALAAVSRLSSDSEMIAPQTSGMSFLRMNRAIFVYGLALSFISFLLMNFVEPRVIELRFRKYSQYLEEMARPNLIAGVINTLGKRSVMYMDRVDGETASDLIFINEADGEEHLMYAANIEVYKESQKGIRIRLLNGNEKIIDLSDKSGPRIAEYSKLRMDFPSPTSKAAQQFRGEAHKSLTTPDALVYLSTLAGKQHREVYYDILIRLFGPLICILFSLFPIPLAAQHTRLRKGSGFGLSLFMIAVYFVATKLAKDQIMAERLSAELGTALPSILFLVWGLLLQASKHANLRRGSSAFKEKWLMKIGQWVLRLRGKFSRRDGRESHWQKVSWRGLPATSFPRLIDLYVIRSFIATFLLIQGSIVVLVTVIEYTQISNMAQKNDIPASTVLQYLLYKLPEFFDQTLFFAMLVTVLVVLSVMSKNQEITAIRASGGSLQRLAMPLVVLGLIASLASLYLSNSFLPSTSRVAVNLRHTIKNRNISKFTRDAWLKSPNGHLFNFEYFDQSDQKLHGTTVYEIDYQKGGVVGRIHYPRLAYQENGSWELEVKATGWRFAQDNDRRTIPEPITIAQNASVKLDVDRDDLSQRDRKPLEFSINELGSYIQYLKQLGLNPLREQTEYFVKIVQPALPLILVVLAIPFGFQFGRRGTFYGIAFGLVVGLTFWLFFELSREMGRTGVLPPIIAGWSVVLMFAASAWYRFLHMDN